MLLSLPFRRPWTSLRSLRPIRTTRYFSISRPRYTVEMGTVETTQRLSLLRQLMQEHKVDVYSMLGVLLNSCQRFPRLTRPSRAFRR